MPSNIPCYSVFHLSDGLKRAKEDSIWEEIKLDRGINPILVLVLALMGNLVTRHYDPHSYYWYFDNFKDLRPISSRARKERVYCMVLASKMELLFLIERKISLILI